MQTGRSPAWGDHPRQQYKTRLSLRWRAARAVATLPRRSRLQRRQSVVADRRGRPSSPASANCSPLRSQPVKHPAGRHSSQPSFLPLVVLVMNLPGTFLWISSATCGGGEVGSEDAVAPRRPLCSVLRHGEFDAVQHRLLPAYRGWLSILTPAA